MAAELATCHVPKDPASPVQAGGYIVACVTFYEQGFGVPSHCFLYMTPSGILHMAAFVALCEAYMGIEPHFNLWNYFFRAWLQQGSSAETEALGNVHIFVQSGLELTPTFNS
jgi:hypothetical protein